MRNAETLTTEDVNIDAIVDQLEATNLTAGGSSDPGHFDGHSDGGHFDGHYDG